MTNPTPIQEKVTNIWLGWDKCYSKNECTNECFVAMGKRIYKLCAPCRQILLLLKVFKTDEIKKDSPVDFFMKQHKEHMDKIKCMSICERNSETEEILKKVEHTSNLFTFHQLAK